MKDKIILWVGIAIIIGVIGLLMAWTDGYFDGTFLGDALSVLMPAALSGFMAMLVVSYWANKIGSGVSGKLILWSFLVTTAVVCVLLLVPAFEPVLEPLLYVGVGIVVITLILLWITGK